MPKTSTNLPKKAKRTSKAEQIMMETEEIVKTIDISQYINDNPLSGLSGTYQSKLVNQIKDEFDDFEQQVFLFNFFCYLNFDEKNDFIVDLNHVWPWLGFTRKDHAKHLLIKEFEIDIDFIIIKTAPEASGAVSQPQNGGQNKEKILMNVDTFKVFCMTANKPRSKEIRKYYVKLERIIQKLVDEQSLELRNQLQLEKQENEQLKNDLEQTQEQLEEIQEQLTIKTEENFTVQEQTLVNSFSNVRGLPVFYTGMVEDDIYKFGWTYWLGNRVSTHKKQIGSFTLKFVIQINECIELEKIIKKELKDKIFSKKYKNKNQTELIRIDENYTENDFIKDIKQYADMFKVQALMKENKQLKKKIEDLKNNSESGTLHISNEQGIICSSCYATKPEDEFGINPTTNTPFSSCKTCRQKVSEKRYDKNKEKIDKQEKEFLDRQAEIQKRRQELYETDETFNCYKCKQPKTASELGVNRKTNVLYKMCYECRGVVPIKEGEIECSKCRKGFKKSLNPISKQTYRTCETCREKDQKVRNNATEIPVIECYYCKQPMEPTINPKNKKYYKNCQTCRDKRRKYDKAKYDKHREKICLKKKEYYQENRIEIREKQKMYYDKNSENIIERKRQFKKECESECEEYESEEEHEST